MIVCTLVLGVKRCANLELIDTEPLAIRGLDLVGIILLMMELPLNMSSTLA